MSEELLIKIQKEPSDHNKFLFIFNHRNYIFQCVNHRRHSLSQENKEDLVSDILLMLYKFKDKIEWNSDYARIKGYMSKVANTWLIYDSRRENRDKRIPLNSLVELEDYQEPLNLNTDNMLETQLQMIEDCLKHAKPNEQRIIRGLLKGQTYKDLGISRQAVSICLKRFSKRILNSDKSIKL
jgi:DNA-directed RNA polymerase specialized sigma24 family protein